MPPKPKWVRCPTEPTVRARNGKFVIEQRYRVYPCNPYKLGSH